ncbi:Histone H4 [Penicillium bovifimosum]|uniref:Ceramide-binding protein SVF1 n=1 Tax=Penicillium bovifimosum TaxID=126998 RepID=A0A9W9GHH9_9EURO|nr:Histone H4 [Penicillium bovifimosum]KAJ5120618.1 Histone H4 [Penicillium bovifimosum]
MNWLKSTLSAVVGTEEPIYGPEAIQSVAQQTETTPYTEVNKEILRWRAYSYTNVETQTFYIMADNGTVVFVQVIYSNIVGIHTTAQFNVKIFDLSSKGNNKWYSDPLSNFMFDENMTSFGADNLSLTLNEDGDSYTIKSTVNSGSLVDLKFSRTAPGFVVGKDGTSYFGTDPKNPWGSMRHAFWPRCSVEGSITTSDQTYDLAGRGVFIMALQGMKPHHAAARWNFINFQTPTYSAIMMEFTTPPSYGSTKVNVGGIVKDGEIIYAGATNTVAHTATGQDEGSDWPAPQAIKWEWTGKTSDSKELSAVVEGPLGPRLDRIDVMAEVPGFIKSIAGSVAGTRPYIFQYSPQEKLSLKLKIGDEEITEEGTMFSESTFIS